MSDCRTLNLMQRSGPPALLVSLPANDVDLAMAARDAGAQGLKVHINIQHAAAGVQFGSLAEERAAIERIVALGMPVGIVPGDASRMASQEELARLPEVGLDFMDVYLQAMPACLLHDPVLPLMAAVGSADMLQVERLKSVNGLPTIQMIEASIIPHDGYGNPLSASDLADYTTLMRLLGDRGLPVMVPTQRRIALADLPALAATGVRALLIGAIVTGHTAPEISAVTRQYREALDRLEPRAITQR